MKKRNICFVAALIILSGVAFYWFQLRPATIRHACNEEARKLQFEDLTPYTLKEGMTKEDIEKHIEDTRMVQYKAGVDLIYDDCIRDRGLSE